MADGSAHQQAERQFRELLRRAYLPHPDEVAHLHRSVVFIWHESNSVVVVDLDELHEQLDNIELTAILERRHA